MELEALEGARQTSERNGPVVLVGSIKTGRERLRAFLDERGYNAVEAGINRLAIHRPIRSSPNRRSLNSRRKLQPPERLPIAAPGSIRTGK
jgi:hypothetical protein